MTRIPLSSCFSFSGSRVLENRKRANAGICLLVGFFFLALSFSPAANAQTSTSTSSSSSARVETQQPDQSGADQSASPEHKSFGGELAEETRESTGEEKEDNENLKHSAVVQFLARKTGMSVHAAHLTALGLNFAIVVIIVVWSFRKFVPGMLRNRSAAIQQALEEARAASQDANRRLSDIENRLRELDVEIGRMQSTAEKEADAEEVRIRKAAEDDIHKVVQDAEQEIALAAKQARRELTAHTASLAIALARKQINIDTDTDQVLVRSFASKLAQKSPQHDDSGKDGR